MFLPAYRDITSHTFCPRTIRPRTSFPDVFTSLYISSLNYSHNTEVGKTDDIKSVNYIRGNPVSG